MMSTETALPTPRKKGGGDTKAKTARVKKQQKENTKGGGNTKAKSSASKTERSSRRVATPKVNRERGSK